MEPQRNDVTVVDIRMPFGSMVVFMVKWAIASIPAFIILVVLGFLIAATLAAFGRPWMAMSWTFKTSGLPAKNSFTVGKRVPKHEAWINDAANVLSGQDRERPWDGLRRYHRETHHQLAVPTVPAYPTRALSPFISRSLKGNR